MTALVFVIGLVACLFVLAFFTRRRYGRLAMALAAGYLISAHWADTVTPFIEQQGVVLIAPPLSTVVATLLTLLPPVVLMWTGPKYSDMFSRIVGSVAFGVLALAFVVEPLADALLLEGPSKVVMNTLVEWQGVIIVAGLIAATLDVLLTRPPKDKDKK